MALPYATKNELKKLENKLTSSGGKLPENVTLFEKMKVPKPTPVSRDGTPVEKLYLNTDLSMDEVVDILKNSGIELDHKFGYDIVSQQARAGITISYDTFEDYPTLIISDAFSEGLPYFVNIIEENAPFHGWNPDFNGEIIIGAPIDIITEGLDLENLSKVISTTPFKPDPTRVNLKTDKKEDIYPTTKITNILDAEGKDWKPYEEITLTLNLSNLADSKIITQEQFNIISDDRCKKISVISGLYGEEIAIAEKFNKIIERGGAYQFKLLNTYPKPYMNIILTFSSDLSVAIDEAVFPLGVTTIDNTTIELDDGDARTSFTSKVHVKTIGNSTLLGYGELETDFITLKSPDGSKFKLTVGNDGTVKADKIL